MRRNTKLLVAATCLHAVLALGAVLYAFAAGSTQFDNPHLSRLFGARVAELTANTLTLPGDFSGRRRPARISRTLFNGPCS